MREGQTQLPRAWWDFPHASGKPQLDSLTRDNYWATREKIVRAPRGLEIYPICSRTRISDRAPHTPSTHRIVPLPACERTIRRVIRHQHPGRSFSLALYLLKHGKLIGINGRIFVDSRFHVPAGKVSSISARKSSRAKAAHRRALPKSVINIAGDPSHPRFLEWKAEGTAPGRFRYPVSSPDCGRCQRDKYDDSQVQSDFHLYVSPTCRANTY